MVGTVLYPLNALKDREPEVWRQEVAKYEGREHVLEKPITPLGCLWNDVLHLSTVHPAIVAAELKTAGFEPLRQRFFEIDAGMLDPERTVIFLNRPVEVLDDTDDAQWLPFDQASLVGLTELSEPTRRYYRESAALGQRPFLYVFLPHVLFHGPLEICGLPVHDV